MDFDLLCSPDEHMVPYAYASPSASDFLLCNLPSLFPTDFDIMNTTSDTGAPVIINLPHRQRRHARPRKQSIDKTEWSRFKETILQLYLENDLKLEDVRATMEQRYGLDATAQMYKKKLAQWGARKNYSRQQKEEALATGASTLNSRPIQHQKLRRYLRQERRRLKAASEQSNPFSPPSFPAVSSSTEGYLTDAKYYYDWYLTQTEIIRKFRRTNSTSAFFDDLWAARLCLAEDPRRAFALMNRGCSNIQALLQEQPFMLIPALGSLFALGEDWKGYKLARRSLLQYIVKMAQKTLRPSHPVTTTASSLLQDEDHTPVISQSVQLLFEAMSQRMPERSCASLMLHFELGGNCIRVRDTAGAESLIEGAAQHAHQTRNRCDWLIQRAKFLLGRISYLHGNFEAAERHWLEVIDLCIESEGRTNRTRPAIGSNWHVGLLYAETGRLTQSEYHLRQAFKGALRWWGADNTDTMHMLQDLEDNLAKQGKYRQLTELRARYGCAYQSLQPFYLHGEGITAQRTT